MTKTILLGFIILIASCASHKNPRQITNEAHDGLKYESLKRYDAKRLSNPNKKEDPLTLCHQGNHTEAEQIFKDKLDKNLNNYVYWNQISTCYIIKKQYPKASQFLDLALNAAKTNNQKAIVMNNFGVIQLENRNYIEAKEYFKKSIELNKKYLTPKYNLSQIYLKHGLYGKAHRILSALLSSNNKDIDFLNSMGHLKLMQKSYKKSLSFFDRIPQEYRSRDDVATNLAMTYYMLNQLDKAKQTLEQSDKKDSYYVTAQVQIEKRIDKILEAKK